MILSDRVGYAFQSLPITQPGMIPVGKCRHSISPPAGQSTFLVKEKQHKKSAKVHLSGGGGGAKVRAGRAGGVVLGACQP